MTEGNETSLKSEEGQFLCTAIMLWQRGREGEREGGTDRSDYGFAFVSSSAGDDDVALATAVSSHTLCSSQFFPTPKRRTEKSHFPALASER